MASTADITTRTLFDALNEFLQTAEANFVQEERAIRPELAGMRIYDSALVGVASADAAGRFLVELLRNGGYEAVYAAKDPRYHMLAPYRSAWSERHVAYACGLGTFGLSRGLITAKGMAGRLGSVITDAPLEPMPHDYDGPFDYCIMCGACALRCPAGAIDPARGVADGKDHELCRPYTYTSRFAPDGTERYGCGKCQVGVPCESRVP